MAIIILEGIDKVGKTEFANKISDKFNIPIYKKNRDECDNYMNPIHVNFGSALGLINFWSSDACKVYMPNFIIDRFHWTEYVYNLIDRDIHEASMGIIEEKMLLDKDRYLIVFLRPVDIKYSSRIHGSDLSKHEKIYEELYNSTMLNKCTGTIYTYDILLNQIEKYISKELL